MPASLQKEIYRQDVRSSGKLLSKQEREAILRPYLPIPKLRATSTPKLVAPARRPIRDFLKSLVHFLIFSVIHLLFSTYIRIRRYYHAISRRIFAILYHHHRTPELIRKDVQHLSKLPKHLSVILELEPTESASQGLEVLLDNVAEISAWCACVGVPMLSVYEPTGALKRYIPTTHQTVAAKLHSYFGAKRPSLQVRAPHMPSFLNGDISEDTEHEQETSNHLGHLSLLLLSSEDGRSTLVDLTKTLAEMSQHDKLSPSDISLDLIDAEISESVMEEPDLLLLFGPEVKLKGYPPWHLRLTEIFHVPDNEDVEYLVWLQGLHRFARAEMRFGR